VNDDVGIRSLLIRNGRVVTESATRIADVLVRGETIAEIGEHLAGEADEIIDASGKLVVPGGIDPHVHLELPVGEVISSDDFFTGTRAAACGGTTTVIDFPTQERGRPMREALDAWHGKAAGKACIDYAFHMIVTDLPRDRVPEMREIADAGVRSFKLFTAYPDRLYVDDATLVRAMRAAAELGAPVLMHAENGIAIDEIVQEARRAGNFGPAWHARTRPAALEAEAVFRCIAIAEVTGATLYIVHLSSAAALEPVRWARARGVPVFAETCPQYLLLDDSRYEEPGFQGAKYVMTPCLRKPEDQAVLWDGVADDSIQVIGTDHCPFCMKDKERGRDDFTRIPNGAPGIENRMALIYSEGVAEGRISLERFVELTSTNAARLFGLFPQKGILAPGCDADIVVFDPERKETISVSNPRTHHMRVDYNVYEGMAPRGFPEVVIARGRIVARNGDFTGRKGAGVFLRRTGS
jgi:dihydropyrimidinase